MGDQEPRIFTGLVSLAFKRGIAGSSGDLGRFVVIICHDLVDLLHSSFIRFGIFLDNCSIGRGRGMPPVHGNARPIDLDAHILL